MRRPCSRRRRLPAVGATRGAGDGHDGQGLSVRGAGRAFRIVAGLLGATFVPSAVRRRLVPGRDPDIHLVHNISGLAGFGLASAPPDWSWRRDPRTAAAFRALAFSAVLSPIAGLFAGDALTGFWFAGAVFAVVLYLVHPDRAGLIRVRSVSGPLLVLGVVALAVAGAFALQQTELQRNGNPALDPHTELHHYSGMAVMALVLAAGALAAATEGGGMRAIGWATGTGAALYGLASLAYPDHLGTVGTLWAILTLLWAVRWPLSRSTRPAGPRDPGTRVGSGRGEALPVPSCRAVDGRRRDGLHGLRAREGGAALGSEGDHQAECRRRAADRDDQGSDVEGPLGG